MFALMALVGCAQFGPVPSPAISSDADLAPAQDPAASFYPVSFRALPGWGDGREAEALQERSCFLAVGSIKRRHPG